MTAMITYSFLQHYWWIIISLLAGLLVFLMFVQGGQAIIFTLPENNDQKRMMINALGRKWEFTFTTLVTFGAATFASFPLFYSTSFGGAYWVWTAVLLSFIVQAIAYEYRSKPANVFGQKTYDIFLLVNGIAGPFLIGTAVGTFFTGADFSLNNMNNVKWGSGWHGLEAFTDPRNISLGLAVSLLSVTNGLLYLINTIDDPALFSRARKKMIIYSSCFLAAFLFFVTTLLLSDGLNFGRNDGRIVVEDFKYLHNFLQMPAILVIFLLGVVMVLTGIILAIFYRSRKGIWLTGPGTVITVFALFLIAAFNNTSFYPSLTNFRNSLTIHNASSSFFTLKVMMYVSFAIPAVFAYIWFAWKAINSKNITSAEMDKEDHLY
jgi:cytochrome bd ubiquinol oxidase subunit II